MTEALFTPDRGACVPTPLARGPWDPGSLHGGPVAALVGRAVEAVDAPAPMLLARTTLELLKPVPMAPLEVTTEVVRPGRRVQLVTASVRAGGAEVVRALCLRVRIADLPAGDDDVAGSAMGARPPAADVALPEDGRGLSFPGMPTDTAFHSAGVRICVAPEPAPGAAVSAWVQLRVPVVAGEEPSPAQRALAAADFGNGISGVLDFTRWVYVNPDLTVTLHREPVGSWIRLDARTDYDGTGVGLAASALADAAGLIGRAAQVLYVERRSGS
jgi:hypothetical protein